MTKAYVFLIIANVYLAQNLRDKRLSTIIMSLCYFVLYFISYWQ